MENKKLIMWIAATVFPANLFLIGFISQKIDMNSVICCGVITLGIFGGIVLALKKGFMHIGGRLISQKEKPSSFYAGVAFLCFIYLFAICATFGIYFQKIRH